MLESKLSHRFCGLLSGVFVLLLFFRNMLPLLFTDRYVSAAVLAPGLMSLYLSTICCCSAPRTSACFAAMLLSLSLLFVTQWQRCPEELLLGLWTGQIFIWRVFRTVLSAADTEDVNVKVHTALVCSLFLLLFSGQLWQQMYHIFWSVSCTVFHSLDGGETYMWNYFLTYNFVY